MPVETEVLAGWTALTDVAREIGMTRQGIHYMVETGAIPSDQIRHVNHGKSRVLLLRDEYIPSLIESRKEGASAS